MILRYVKARDLADEIFQDVFLKICKNRDQFRESVSFNSWIVTISKNTCIDFLRKQQRSLKTDSFDDNGGGDKRQLTEIVASEDMTPDQSLTIQMESEDLTQLLDKLPREQRDTFYMKIIMEFTFEEIGRSMGCSTNTAKSRYRYALETLRGLVKRKRMLDVAV